MSNADYELICLESGLEKPDFNGMVAAYHEEVFGNDESDDKMHGKQIDELDSDSKMSELAQGLAAAIEPFFAKSTERFMHRLVHFHHYTVNILLY